MITKIKYENTMNVVRKYAGLALLAGALALPYSARCGTLPINKARETATQSYSNNSAKIKYLFNEAIKDKRFSLDEQRQIEKYFLEAKRINANLPQECKTLDFLIDYNLHSLNAFNTGLQAELEKNGLDVEVESDYTNKILGLIVMAIGSVGTTLLTKKLFGGQK